MSDLDYVNSELYGESYNLSDEELVNLASYGDQIAFEIILDKYKNIVKNKARTYFMIGAEREDVIQEGMIGLFKAVRCFNQTKNTSFKVFAELCVTRQIITAIKTATRQKHVPLNSYVSFHKPVFDGDCDKTLVDVLSNGEKGDPESVVIKKEEHEFMTFVMEEILSSFEKDVLRCYLEGKSYQQMAIEMDKHVKSIDNALQRIKKKVEKVLEVEGDKQRFIG